MSIHCDAKKDDIEKTVLMPGDPLRAKYIAENFLDNPRLVNTVRNILAYTGTYNSKPITVFSSGMGMPSIGIYSYELYKFYDVEKIIRIGSCGTYNKDIHLFDTILVDKSYTEGNFAYEWSGKKEYVSTASKELNDLIDNTAKKLGINCIRGNAFCNDCFDGYLDNLDDFISRLPKDVLACEMEAFALFYIAKYFGKQASCLLTVVDAYFENKSTTAEERERSLNEMITLALESVN